MTDNLTFIIMAGGGGETPVEQAVAGACRAAARDTVERALEADVASRIVVVTDHAEWAETLAGLPVVIDLDKSRTLFHFGRRLAGVIERHDISQVNLTPQPGDPGTNPLHTEWLRFPIALHRRYRLSCFASTQAVSKILAVH